MQKSRSVQNIISIIAVADEYSMQFLCFWFCVPPDFVVQINEFFYMVLFSAVIHKRREKKLISKTIKYKLDSSSKVQIVFFYPKDIQKTFLETIGFVENLEMTQTAGGGVLCSLRHYYAILRRSICDSLLVLFSFNIKSFGLIWLDCILKLL